MHTNALIHETSPYLLQHAHNPVDWLPWGETAFAKARREHKPIFLSIGYSTCHWCHVMERESFENEAVAAILNTRFVPIKVDREERPDVDRVYMLFVQATTGAGGWPLSVWLTPALTPFFGGTYFPPDTDGGRRGFRSLLQRIADAWRDDSASLAAAGADILARLREREAAPAGGAPRTRAPLARAYAWMRDAYDPREGGLGAAPKFPQPCALAFLLRYSVRAAAPAARDMALHTLRRMAAGGIHDPLGGFHRYAVDARWRVPHFEKMLYDQALLTEVYLDAFRLTGESLFAETARDILAFVARDLTAPEGGFYSALDADSARPENPADSAEGAFYVWTAREVAACLESEDARLCLYAYGIEPGGNVRDDPHGAFTGRNVLHGARTLEETAARFGVSPAEAEARLARGRDQLRIARAARPAPARDDKVIAAWNGLMVAAYARAGRTLGDPRLIAAAARAAAFLRAQLRDPADGMLRRAWRAGRAGQPGFAADYTGVIHGLLELYAADFDVGWLDWALELQARMDDLFWDPERGGYFETARCDDGLPIRLKEDHDSAEPCANSVAASNLTRMACLLGDPAAGARADRILEAFADTLARAPHALPLLLNALDERLDEPPRIVIAGAPDTPDTRALLEVACVAGGPGSAVLLADGGPGQAWLAERLPEMRAMRPVDGRAAAYVCVGRACLAPVTDPAALRVHPALAPRSAD